MSRCLMARYKSKMKAMKAALRLFNNVDNPGFVVYYCSSCRGWHIAIPDLIEG